MKNSKDEPLRTPDGTLAIPEQFVQLNSKRGQEIFGKDYENIEQVYRGVNGNRTRQRLNPWKSVFAANKELASKYTYPGQETNYLKPNNKFYNYFTKKSDAGVFNLFHRKSYNGFLLDNASGTMDRVNLTNKSDRIDKISKELEYWESLRYKNPRILILKESLKNLKNLDDKIIEQMRRELGNYTDVNVIAKYIEDKKIDFVKIKNINDGGFGDVIIVNHKRGNYLKSLIGNNGFFDMTNPNIYK